MKKFISNTSNNTKRAHPRISIETFNALLRMDTDLVLNGNKLIGGEERVGLAWAGTLKSLRGITSAKNIN